MQTKSLKEDNADYGAEHEFWAELRNICLLPEQAAFNSSGKTLSCMNIELINKLGVLVTSPNLKSACILSLAKCIVEVLWLFKALDGYKRGVVIRISYFLLHTALAAVQHGSFVAAAAYTKYNPVGPRLPQCAAAALVSPLPTRRAIVAPPGCKNAIL